MRRQIQLHAGMFLIVSLPFAWQSSDAATSVIFVDQNAPVCANCMNGGETWEDAYIDIQDALDDANSAIQNASGPIEVEIWVASGTYRPSKLTDLGDLRSATFALVPTVRMYGGFKGDETNRDERQDPTFVFR